MSGRRPLVGLFAFVLALLASILSTGVANAAPVTGPPATQYCFTEVAPIAPGSRVLDVASKICSDTAAENSVLPSNAEAAAGITLLVTFFQNQDYGGGYDTIGGRFGTCDSAGYSIRTALANFNAGGISSYKLNGACNRSTIFTGEDFSGFVKNFSGQNIRYVGAVHEDSVRAIKVRKG